MALAERWRSNSLTIGVGMAGSGKTSLLHAGVIPQMTDGNSELLPPGRLSYDPAFPFGSLPAHNLYTLALLRSWSPGDTAGRLAGVTVRDFVRHRAERGEGVILAAIDQGEELLGDAGSRRMARRHFLIELAEALRVEPRLHLLLLTRDEAFDEIAEVLGYGARYEISGLTRQGAIEAVEKPVASVGRSFADGAAEQIVTSLQVNVSAGRGEPSRSGTDDRVVPALLQVVCSWMWNALPADLDVITPRDVSKFGDAGLALAAHCGHVIAAVADEHDLPVTKLRSWMLSTFITEYGSRGTAYEGPAATAGMPNPVARALEDRHLLSVQLKSGLRWYELQSDCLIVPLREATEQRPAYVSPQEHLEAAGRALTRGDLDLAERFAAEALRAARETDHQIRARANSLLGNVALDRGNPGEAAGHYRLAATLYEAARDRESVARQLAATGQMLLAQGQAADAVDQLRAAVSRQPNDPVLQTELGLALWQLGDGRGAVAVLTSVLGIDGGNTLALRTRGEILASIGDASDAMRDLDRVPLGDMPSSRAARGLALARLGDRSAASREIEDALSEAPRNGPVLLYAAQASEVGGDEGTTEKLALRAVDAMDPPLSPQHRNLALKLARRRPSPG